MKRELVGCDAVTRHDHPPDVLAANLEEGKNADADADDDRDSVTSLNRPLFAGEGEARISVSRPWAWGESSSKCDSVACSTSNAGLSFDDLDGEMFFERLLGPATCDSSKHG
jgi:hypothetical protein